MPHLWHRSQGEQSVGRVCTQVLTDVLQHPQLPSHGAGPQPAAAAARPAWSAAPAAAPLLLPPAARCKRAVPSFAGVAAAGYPKASIPGHCTTAAAAGRIVRVRCHPTAASASRKPPPAGAGTAVAAPPARDLLARGRPRCRRPNCGGQQQRGQVPGGQRIHVGKGGPLHTQLPTARSTERLVPHQHHAVGRLGQVGQRQQRIVGLRRALPRLVRPAGGGAGVEAQSGAGGCARFRGSTDPPPTHTHIARPQRPRPPDGVAEHGRRGVLVPQQCRHATSQPRPSAARQAVQQQEAAQAVAALHLHSTGAAGRGRAAVRGGARDAMPPRGCQPGCPSCPRQCPHRAQAGPTWRLTMLSASERSWGPCQPKPAAQLLPLPPCRVSWLSRL